MKNKKLLLFISSILIVIFHFWISVFNYNKNEMLIVRNCFIGVDIFFFLSGYSISKSKIDNYKEFILSRFIKIYLLFIIFCITSFIYNSETLSTLLLNIIGYNFIKSGGGSFLWYVPAIMLLYLILPLFKKLDNSKNYIYILGIIIWVSLSILFSNYIDNKSMLILINRIPIILLGYYFSKWDIFNKLSKLKRIIISSILLVIGVLLIKNKVDIKYIYDFKYITCIPLVIGLISIIDLIPENKIIDYLGSISLEMYCIQMLFGFKIANTILKNINNYLLVNLLVIVNLIVLSLILNYVYNKLVKQSLKIFKLN